MNRLWFLSLALLCWASASAQVTLNAVPGGIVEIPLAPLDGTRPEAYFGQERVLVMAVGSRWAGLVGLPLELVPGRYVLRARLSGEEEPVAHSFTVYPRRFAARPVAAPGRMPLDAEQVALEWRDTLDAELPLQPPVALPARPLFGRYEQSTDNEARQFKFVVFRVDTDAAIAAPGKGRIARMETDKRGTFICIDHGMGLLTCTGPVVRAEFSPGDEVQAGQPLGRVSPENEDEPAVLYWSVLLNGAAVNPFLLSSLARAPLSDAGAPADP